MMRRLKPMMVFILLACSIVGCNSANKDQELQQQRLLTELAKTNAESLAAIEKRQAELMKMEGEIKTREVALQESLKAFKNREETLRKREDGITEREKTLGKKVSQVEAAWSQVQAANQAIAAKRDVKERRFIYVAKCLENEMVKSPYGNGYRMYSNVLVTTDYEKNTIKVRYSNVKAHWCELELFFTYDGDTWQPNWQDCRYQEAELGKTSSDKKERLDRLPIMDEIRSLLATCPQADQN